MNQTDIHVLGKRVKNMNKLVWFEDLRLKKIVTSLIFTLKIVLNIFKSILKFSLSISLPSSFYVRILLEKKLARSRIFSKIFLWTFRKTNR